ncbi:MAG TPA: PfkB family carbohydrate kinase [Dehalococcoidia bacterium]|nr:PfkB family carbohydrate kinase [Dehalococcoidia bacterium]
MTPDILLAGHIVKDITPQGWRPGGGAYYAATQAKRLGLRVAVVTACADDVDPASLLPDIEWRVAPSRTTTTFENVYRGRYREQRAQACERKLELADIPAEWRRAPIVLLTSVLQDIAVSLPGQLAAEAGLVGLGAQGWLRRLDGKHVLPGEVEPRPAWLAGDAVFVSDEDVTEPEAVAAWRESVPVVVLTRGALGCTVWHPGGRDEIPGFQSEHEVDPTGAGDVFAAAFLVRFRETSDAIEAGWFAAAAARFAVEGEGAARIAGRAEIEALVRNARMIRSR